MLYIVLYIVVYLLYQASRPTMFSKNFVYH